jgi:hypothetical protein
MSLGFASTLVAGCYTLQPAMRAPEAGTVVALDITDVGRVALSGSMGPEIGQLEGRLISSENGEYLISVSSVRYLRGGTQIWAGERVRVREDYVGNTYEKRFSKGRTLALGATVAAGIAALVVSRDLFGYGDPDRPPVCCDTIASIRLPRP